MFLWSEVHLYCVSKYLRNGRRAFSECQFLMIEVPLKPREEVAPMYRGTLLIQKRPTP